MYNEFKTFCFKNCDIEYFTRYNINFRKGKKYR